LHATDATRCARVDRLYKKHTLRPADEVFEKLKAEKIPPNYSLRMTQLTAAVIRPQILTLEERVAIYDRRYKAVEAKLNQVPHIIVPKQLPQVRRLAYPSPHAFDVVVLATNPAHGLHRADQVGSP
jgi:dTDP-4-amino-4,6-dideoxygalactose transaminase